MRHCSRCVMPDTKPDLEFDKNGVCDACRSSDLKNQIDWEERRQQFAVQLDRYRSKDGSRYDCVIPVSGGKDSTYQVYVAKHLYGMNPLCVTFEPTVMTPLGRQNLENLRKLGVDLISIEKNPIVYRKLGREAFRRVGDHDWPNHVGIFTLPVRIACQWNIPLIIWGENSQLEYGGPATSRTAKVLDRRWLEEFGGLLGNRVEDMLSDEITARDLLPYVYPSDEDVQRVGVTGLFLGYYFKWDARAQLEIIQKHGFAVKEDGPIEGTYTNYENLDCALVGMHDYLKFTKYGFGRATDHACLDIRNGRITREQGVELVRQYDGKVPRQTIADFLAYFEMSEGEFARIMDSFTNRSIFKTDSNGRFVRDEGGNLILKKPVWHGAESVSEAA